MPTCETCGNPYDKCFDVIIGGKHHTFDSFECAIRGGGADLRSLFLPDHRTWCGGWGAYVLLR